jgi:hypothetical protein
VDPESLLYELWQPITDPVERMLWHDEQDDE